MRLKENAPIIVDASTVKIPLYIIQHPSWKIPNLSIKSAGIKLIETIEGVLVGNQVAWRNIVNAFKQVFHALTYVNVLNGKNHLNYSQNNESMTNKNII